MKYSIKMRASKNIEGKDHHISGAERIIDFEDLYETVEALQKRALLHNKGEPDFINIKIEKVHEDEMLHLDALKTTTVEVKTKEEGLQYISDFLKNKNIANSMEIVNLLTETSNMRGAVLLDINTFKRLEDNEEKGIRVTYMDYDKKMCDTSLNTKNHYFEALALATKVVNGPGIVAELCISDDPDYITGYIATKDDGYIRITKLKEMGSEKGARIFLFNGDEVDLINLKKYLTEQKVIVHV